MLPRNTPLFETAERRAPERSIVLEIYKAYLVCAARIIRSLDGHRIIRSLDGHITAYDRIMAVFISNSQTSNAAKCSLQINWAVKNIVNPSLKKQYPQGDYAVKQVVGIDTSEIRAPA